MGKTIIQIADEFVETQALSHSHTSDDWSEAIRIIEQLSIRAKELVHENNAQWVKLCYGNRFSS